MKVLVVASNANVKSYHEIQALKNMYPHCKVVFAILGNELSYLSPRRRYLLEKILRQVGVQRNYLKNIGLLPNTNPYDDVVTLPPGDLEKLVGKVKPDVIQTQTPYTNFQLTKRVSGDVPVVHDAEDLVLMNIHATPKKLREEKDVLLRADGVIFPTVKEYQTLGYTVENRIFLYPYISMSTVPACQKNKLSLDDGRIHAVYIGSVYHVGRRSFLSYFLELARYVHVHVYLSNYWHSIHNSIKKEARRNRGLHLHTPLQYHRISDTIQIYDYGLVPYPLGFLKTTLTFGMKTLEYLYAGLLPLFRSNGSITNHNNNKQIGYILKKTAGILSINPQIKTRLINNFDRNYHLMERHIHKLYRLYESLLS